LRLINYARNPLQYVFEEHNLKPFAAQPTGVKRARGSGKNFALQPGRNFLHAFNALRLQNLTRNYERLESTPHRSARRHALSSVKKRSRASRSFLKRDCAG
jgi:hypothetical protein